MRSKILILLLTLVLCLSGIGPASLIPETTITAEAASTPAAPVYLNLLSSSSGLKLSWNKVSGATGYYVYRKTGNGSYKKIATVKGKVSYTDKNVKSGKTYTYKVRAYKGKKISPDTALCIQITYKPGSPITPVNPESPQPSSDYMDVADAYTALNNFRTTPNQWQWNSDNKTKTYFNTNKSNQLQPLVKNAALEATAQIRAKELVQRFAHTRPDGTSCFTTYPSMMAYGENIAYGYPSASSVTTAWAEENDDYAGQGHRQNMLDKTFNAVGIACYKQNGICYWVQCFGRI